MSFRIATVSSASVAHELVRRKLLGRDDLDPRGLKKYTETMRVAPQETAKVTYEVVYMGDDQGWRWKIDSAKGVE